jgi:microcystin-dependent protein
MSTSPVYGGLQPSSVFGDIKSGRQTADHAGWILCDGRLKTALTATQQPRATALGIGANIDDARGKALFAAGANGIVLGATGGAATATVNQANLPNVNLNATAVSAGTPAGTVSTTVNAIFHSSTGDGFNGGRIQLTDRSSFTVNNPSELTVSASFSGSALGTHGHTVPLGGSGTALPVQNPYLGVNVFIYLGT